MFEFRDKLFSLALSCAPNCDILSTRSFGLSNEPCGFWELVLNEFDISFFELKTW